MKSKQTQMSGHFGSDAMVSLRALAVCIALVGFVLSGIIVPASAVAAPPELTVKATDSRVMPRDRVDARRTVGNSWNSCVSARQAAYSHASAICGDESRVAWYDFESCDRNPTGYSTIKISYNCFSDR